MSNYTKCSHEVFDSLLHVSPCDLCAFHEFESTLLAVQVTSNKITRLFYLFQHQ